MQGTQVQSLVLEYPTCLGATKTFALKYFFSESITKQDGGEISTREIKDKVREVIANEDKTHPITDDELVEILHASGYAIARRTVAKYREQLGIPVARLRHQI